MRIDSVQTHIDDYLDVGGKLEIFSFDQKSTDRWMMADLLQVDMHIAKFSLKGLAQDRVEWFLDTWICSVNEHKSTCHVLHLLDEIDRVCNFIRISR